MFVKSYADRAYRHVTTVRHKGLVLSFAMDDRRRIFYTVLDPSVEAADDADRWSASPGPLPFPREIARVGFAVAEQTQVPVVRQGSTASVAPGTPVAEAEIDPFLSSTARLSADARFQVLSDGGHLYVFRQSISAETDPDLMIYAPLPADAQGAAAAAQTPIVDGTLLVDRFVLVGTELQATREVRFQRSRSRTRPQSAKDSLGAKDLDGQPFVEPTQALRFVAGLKDGHFTVVLVPTQVAEVWRWQIFVDNQETALIDAFSIERSADGLFDTRGTAPPDAAALQPGGYAGAALAFARDDDRLEVSAGALLGGRFTIEAWIKPDAGDRSRPAEVALIGADAADGDVAKAGPSVWIARGTRVRAGFGDGTTWHDTTTGDIVRPGAWNHLAITFDGTYLRVYVDAILRHRSTALSGMVPAPTPISRIGAVMQSFRGILDEVRVWDVVRARADVASAMPQRLTGLEPGLVAYWRLDDGNGDTAWDLAGGPHPIGAIAGPTWVTSDAPVADSPGISRQSFRIYPRIVASGLSSLLYYQQENARTGYTGAEKPLKRAARVMLAMATYDGNPEQRHDIAILDFGVARDGKLAQVPTELMLPTLRRPRSAGGTTAQRVAEVGRLAADVASRRQDVDEARRASAQALILDQVLDGGAQPEQLDLSPLDPAMRMELFWYAGARAWRQLGGADALRDELRLAQRAAHANASLLAQLEAELAASTMALTEAETALAGGVNIHMPVISIDARGLSASGAVLDFASSVDAPLLFDSALGRVSLYFRGDGDQFFVAGYDTLTTRARTIVPAASGSVSFVTKSANLPTGADDAAPPVSVAVSDGDTPDTCTVTVKLASPAGTVTEAWRHVPRDAADLAAALNGASSAPVFAGAAAASDGRTDALKVPNGVRVRLPAGAALRVGDRTLTLRSPVPAGATTLPITTASITVNAGTPVYATAYDYAANASTTQVAGNLTGGSLLVTASANGAAGPVTSDSAIAVPPDAAANWLSQKPGGSLSLDGHGAMARTTDPAALASLAAGGDLTVEAWVRPGSGAGLGRVVTYAGPGVPHTLALRPEPSARRFDGTSDAVVVPSSSMLQFSGPITLEAWLRPTATDGLRNIVAHGYRSDPAGEVFLRIANGAYQAGSWDGRNHFTAAPIPPGDVGAWVHLAGVYDGATWRLYRNGVQIAATPDQTGAVSVGAGWAIGSASSGKERFFAGSLDEVRIWSRGHSAAEIAGERDHRVTGSETGLVGYWRPDLPEVFHYRDQPGAAPTNQGRPTPTDGPFPGWTPIAAVGDRLVQSRDRLPSGRWSHLAAVFRQGHGVRLAGGDSRVDCGASETLDVVGDLTLEAGVLLDDLREPQGIIGRGTLADVGGAAGVPYALTVNPAGRLVFTFTDANGTTVPFTSRDALTAGVFHRIAVTRRRTTVVDPVTPGQTPADPNALVNTYYDIAFFIDGAPAGSKRYVGPDPQSSDRPTRIGEAVTVERSAPASLRGALSDVRVWNAARQPEAFAAPIRGTEAGLVSWWRFDENAGTTAMDTKSTNHATLRGGVSWVKTPDPQGSDLVLLRDGAPVATAPPGTPAPALAPAAAQLTLGGLGNPQPADFLPGEVAEVRIWRTARTRREIQDNLFRRLTGELEDLSGYYPIDLARSETVIDHGLRDNSLRTAGAAAQVLSTAPLGEDVPQIRDVLLDVPTEFNETISGAPAVAEYAELQTDTLGRLSGAFKRCYALARNGRWDIVSGYKLGDLVAEWVGQAQFAPQLVGYIEGAPPVPGENLTREDSYADASSVAITQADTTTYTYASTRDKGFDMSVDAAFAVGGEGEVHAGVGVESQILKVKALLGYKASFENSLGWLDEASSGHGSTVTRVSTLALRGRREGPSEVSHAPLGARYVPENTGFALVQSETADVFALRLAHTGALVSYQMRPNPDIPKDWNIITFPIDPRYTKQGTLDGKIGGDVDADYPNAKTYSPDSSYFKPIEAYALKNRIVRDEQRLRALFEQYDAGAVGRRQAGGAADVASGRMGGRLPRVEKRNLVNTYVWTADGGQFAEEEQTLDTLSESSGGSYAFKGLAGITADIELGVSGAAINAELSALFGGHLNLTVTKGLGSQTSFAVQSTANPESDISAAGGPGRQHGKVDAYRYMTFYLDPQSDHHDAFYERVVDPLWLSQSGDPAALALANARQPGKRPACWRVMHRVTYVSRVLEPVPDHPDATEELNRALRKLDIDSNYELVKTLDPFVRDQAARYAEFVTAVRTALETYLPDLLPYKEQILAFLVLYYGVADGPGLAGAADDLSAIAPAPPSVSAGADQEVALAAGVALNGSVIDELVDSKALAVEWSVVDGPGTVKFDDPKAAQTAATFSDPGVYVLRITADNGRASSWAEATVTVSAALAGDGTPVTTAGTTGGTREPPAR